MSESIASKEQTVVAEAGATRRPHLPSLLSRDAVWPFVVPACLLLASLVLRFPSFFPVMVGEDEGTYMVQAREWLRGGWPYVAVWDMHPIGAPALFALTFSVLGESLFAVRFLSVLAVAATGAALYQMVRVAGGPRAVGLAAGLIYTGHSLFLSGVSTNTELLFAPFVALAMAGAIAAARRALDEGAPPGWRDTLLVGVPVGLALLIKSNVAVEGSAAFLLMIVPAWWRGVLPVGRLLALAACYAVVCAAPTLLMGAVYLLRGELDAYIDGNFLGPLRYLGGEAAPRAEVIRIVSMALLNCALLFALGTAALVMGARRRAHGFGLLSAALLLWFVAATIQIAALGKFYDHYFLAWLPPLATLGALGAWRLARAVRPGPAAAAFAIVVGMATLVPWTNSLAQRALIGFGLRNPVEQVAALVAAGIEPGEPVYVVNYAPIVYFLARAGTSTPYVFPAHLAGNADGKLGTVNPAGIDLEAEVTRILDAHPRVIVLHRGHWGSVRPTIAGLVSDALARSYVRAGSVDVAGGPVEVWRHK